MNTLSLTDKSKDLRLQGFAVRPVEAQSAFEETWFAAEPPSTSVRSTMPPVVRVGAFLGEPDVDAWLR